MPDFSIELLDLPHQHEPLALQISRAQNSAIDAMKPRGWPELARLFFKSQNCSLNTCPSESSNYSHCNENSSLQMVLNCSFCNFLPR